MLHLPFGLKSKDLPNVIVAVLALSVILLLCSWKIELLPQVLLGATAVLFAFLAYQHSADKFRLELFEKRFEVYDSIIEFCSVVLAFGSLKLNEENREAIQRGLNAADKSFRGIGIHKSKALFGPEIIKELNTLNEHFAYIMAFGDDRMNAPGYDAAKYWKTVQAVVDTANRLPEIFKPYVYFGDYKIDSF